MFLFKSYVKIKDKITTDEKIKNDDVIILYSVNISAKITMKSISKDIEDLEPDKKIKILIKIIIPIKMNLFLSLFNKR